MLSCSGTTDFNVFRSPWHRTILNPDKIKLEIAASEPTNVAAVVTRAEPLWRKEGHIGAVALSTPAGTRSSQLVNKKAPDNAGL
jgi:hypothetical protein